MTWTTTWRALVVLALTALTAVALVSLVHSLSAGRDAQPTARVTATPSAGSDGCASLPEGVPVGSQAAASRDARRLEEVTSTIGTGSLVEGVGVGRCDRVWVVRVIVSDLTETRSLPARGPSGTPVLRVLGGPFRAS